jgi:uncharacterized membrane protein YebE (DUF533 family)
MKNDTYLNKGSMTGGLLGALAGTLVSGLSHKTYDKPGRKAAKTGFFAAIGFLIGELIENWFRRK